MRYLAPFVYVPLVLAPVLVYLHESLNAIVRAIP